jgi:membrane protein YqaA with SNARE-associated domain
LISASVLQSNCTCFLLPANVYGGGAWYRDTAAASASNPSGALEVELGCFTAILSQRHSSQQQQQQQQQRHLLPAAEAAGYDLVSVVLVLADGVPVPGEADHEEPHIVGLTAQAH